MFPGNNKAWLFASTFDFFVVNESLMGQVWPYVELEDVFVIVIIPVARNVTCTGDLTL